MSDRVPRHDAAPDIPQRLDAALSGSGGPAGGGWSALRGESTRARGCHSRDGRRPPFRRWHRALAAPLRVAALVAVALLAACAKGPPPGQAGPAERKPAQAGQPLDPAVTAARLLATQAAAVAGDQTVVQGQIDAMSEDVGRAMRVPDPARQLPPEPARRAAASVPGVSSVAWIDRGNILALVDGAAYRSHSTIDRICVALEPLGDTLWVSVHLQDRRASDGPGMDVLARNCQLPPGQSAFLQRQRQVDALDPASRAAHRDAQDAMRHARKRKAADDRANAEALRNIREM